jgi:hypothetical protein
VLRQVGVIAHQLLEHRASEPENCAAPHDSSAQVGGLADDQVQLTQEASGAVARQDRTLMTGDGLPGHLDLAGLDDDEVALRTPG